MTSPDLTAPELERLAAGEADDALTARLAACPASQQRLTALQAEDSLLRQALGAELDRALRPAPPRGRRLLATLAAAAALIAVTIWSQPAAAPAPPPSPGHAPVASADAAPWEPAPPGWRPPAAFELGLPAPVANRPAASPAMPGSSPTLVERLAAAKLVLVATIAELPVVQQGPEGMAGTEKGRVVLQHIELLKGAEALPAVPPVDAQARARAKALVEQLGARRWAAREQAHQALLAMGPGVLEQVRAGASHEQLEVRARVASLQRAYKDWQLHQLIGSGAVSISNTLNVWSNDDRGVGSNGPHQGWRGVLSWDARHRHLTMLTPRVASTRRALACLADPWERSRDDDVATRADALEALAFQADRRRAALAFAASVAARGVPKVMLPFRQTTILDRHLARLAQGLDAPTRAKVAKLLADSKHPHAQRVLATLGRRGE